ncbi:MAG: DUF4147 domain-containing protein [Bacteriovoracaceae bacterium]
MNSQQNKRIPIEELKDKLIPESLYRSNLSYDSGILKCKLEEFSLKSYSAIKLLAIGKAAAKECLVVKELLGLKNSDLSVITKIGHGLNELSDVTVESDHPFVSKKSLLAGDQALEFARNCKKDELLIVCLSGGASSLVEKNSSLFEFEEIERISKFMLASDLGIESINFIRKCFSLIKNGGLAKACPATVMTLINCDVSNLAASDVGSGPTIYNPLDPGVLENLLTQSKLRGLENSLKEKLKKSLIQSRESHENRESDAHFIVTSYKDLIDLMDINFSESFKLTFNEQALDEPLESGFQKICTSLKSYVPQPRHVHVSFGELTIQVEGNGLGGRNSHFVLWAANKIYEENVLNFEISELKNLYIFSFATDGSDGPTDSAGAWVDYDSFIRTKDEALKALRNFDSYHYFKSLKQLLMTGPTGTNLMDIRGIGFY